MDVKEIDNGDGTISLCFEIDEELYNLHGALNKIYI